MSVEKRYLTLKELSEYLDIPFKSLQLQTAPSAKNKLKINGHQVKISRVNRRLRFDRFEIDRLMALDN